MLIGCVCVCITVCEATMTKVWFAHNTSTASSASVLGEQLM